MNKILNPDKDIKDIIRILENEIDKKRKQKWYIIFQNDIDVINKPNQFSIYLLDPP